jgi:High potential iron-sulfur protein
MNQTISRRSLLERVGLIAGALATMPMHSLRAADQPHLSTTDPTAAALGYTEDATKVDVSKSPTYRPGQKCATCMQNTGAPG